MVNKWTDSEIELLKELYPKYGKKETAKILNRSENAIAVKARRLGIYRPHHTYNQDYFEEINSSDKAYWLGFIYADGNVSVNPSNRNYEISIELSIKDKHHLENFVKAINSDANIVCKSKQPFKNKGIDKTYQTTSVRIYSKNITESLIKHNILPDKSNISKRIEDFGVPDCYIWDFIRGYFDGDGSISTSTHNITHYKYMRIGFVCHQKEFLLSLKDLFDNFDINAYVYEDRGNWNLHIRAIDSVEKFLNKIYDNPSTYLQRKHDKYLLLKEVARTSGDRCVVPD